jgi:hypothetical protein
MAQGDAVIANLQSALGCAGKCDCCDGLQAQIDSLNARLDQYIPISQKQEIIDQSVTIGAPLAAGFVMTQVVPKIAAVEAVAFSASAGVSALSPPDWSDWVFIDFDIPSRACQFTRREDRCN